MPQGILKQNIDEFELIIANFNREVLAITNGARGGLIQAAKFVHRDMQVTRPLEPERVPPIGGNLRRSWVIRNVHGGQIGSRQFGIMMGYTASYALWVHEMVDAKNWSREGSGPHWFRKALVRNRIQMLQIIENGIKPNIGKNGKKL